MLPVNKYFGISKVKKLFPNEYNKILEFNVAFGDVNWSQKLYNYNNNITQLPKCICGKLLPFIKFSRGYSKYCSNSCRYSDEDLKNRIKRTLIGKFGVENPLQSKEIQNIRKTNSIEKNGVSHPSKLNIVKEKIKQTNIRKYGVSTNLLCESTKEKIKQTNIKKYGVEHNSQSNEIKEKKKQTNLKNCGHKYNFQSDEFKEESKKTYLKKLGVAHSSLSNEVRKKQIITKKKNKIIELVKALNISPSDIILVNNSLIINNYCKIHKSFEITTNLLHQRRFKYDNRICTKCYPIQKQISGGEIELYNYISTLENCKNKVRNLLNNSEIDILIPAHNLGIEYDGLYWHSDAYKNKNYHLSKTIECQKLGITLIHVFEDEWLFKKEIVKSIINSKLNIYSTKIYARKTKIQEIDSKTAKEFLNENHLQGNVNAKIRIGLFYENQLVSIMSFGKKRLPMGNKTNVDGDYEMFRFCSKLNTHVVGGASKILKYFIATYRPKSILTFADKRYSQGYLYEQLGFKYVGDTKPNYYYFKSNELKRYYRFKFRKDKLIKEGFDPQKTEHEIMKERGYYCIYDCGNMKFILNL